MLAAVCFSSPPLYLSSRARGLLRVCNRFFYFIIVFIQFLFAHTDMFGFVLRRVSCRVTDLTSRFISLSTTLFKINPRARAKHSAAKWLHCSDLSLPTYFPRAKHVFPSATSTLLAMLYLNEPSDSSLTLTHAYQRNYAQRALFSFIDLTRRYHALLEPYNLITIITTFHIISIYSFTECFYTAAFSGGLLWTSRLLPPFILTPLSGFFLRAFRFSRALRFFSFCLNNNKI